MSPREKTFNDAFQSLSSSKFEYAREHADASGLLNHHTPLLPALLSIDLEQEARLDDHEERLAELEAAVERCEKDPQRESHHERGTQ